MLLLITQAHACIYGRNHHMLYMKLEETRDVQIFNSPFLLFSHLIPVPFTRFLFYSSFLLL